MSQPVAYLNGRFLPYAEAALPLHDAGFVLGATVTDFVRTFRQKLYLLPEHLARFRAGCATAFLVPPPLDAELTAIAEELVARNAKLLAPGQELALILFATPGSVGYLAGLPGGAGDGPPTLGMHTFPLPVQRYARFFREGVRLALSGPFASESALLPPDLKHRSRMHWWRADRIARRDCPPGSLPLLLTGAGDALAETAIGNLLVVQDGVVKTPAHGILPGISRRVAADLCGELGIPFAEDAISFEPATYSEAMLTGTAFCVAGVSEMCVGKAEGERWPIPWPGPIFQRLLAAWSERVGVDIAGQFLTPP